MQFITSGDKWFYATWAVISFPDGVGEGQVSLLG